jgi:cytochrome c-type biogenesis protein CcmH/NrfF
MFRQITVIFLFLVLSIQVFSRGLIVLDYQFNQAAFAKNCENITRPVLHCNGKCQMVKKIQDSQKQEQIPGKFGIR